MTVATTLPAARDGAVQIGAALGHGTSSFLLFPVGPHECGLAPVHGLVGRSVQVVEHLPGAFSVLIAVLVTAGAEVKCAADPQQVIGLFEDSTADCDLLIADYDLPRMACAELVTAARSARPDLPVMVAMSVMKNSMGT